MYKVLLIDDEAVILEGLKNLIDWEKLGTVIVDVAKDGKEGVKKIERHNPDIVISDIAMPNCSGIELLKRTEELDMGIKVILLSGYQEFEYARAAVRYGAVEYLLKPVSPEELERVVMKTVDQIREKDSVHVLQRKDSPEELLFQQSLSGEKPEVLVKQIREISYTQKIPGAIGVSVRLLYRNVKNQDENRNLIRFEIYEFIQQWLAERKCGTVIRREYATCYILLYLEEDRKKIAQLCNALAKQLKEVYKVETIIGTGGWTDELGKVLYLYKTAKFAGELYYFEEKNYIAYEEIKKEYCSSTEEYQNKIKQLRIQIATDYPSMEVVGEIIECTNLIRNIHYGNKNAVVNSVILMNGEIYNTLEECGLLEENSREKQEEFLENLMKKGTFQGMQNLVREYYNGMFLKLRLLGGRRESSEIVRIKQYIKEHYHETITLEELADYIGMNPSYMSVFFKKETGQNYKNYLTEIRMKEAIRLLNSTDKKSYEIAEVVGYKDIKQFREKFREYYGVSPQKYRKKGAK